MLVPIPQHTFRGLLESRMDQCPLRAAHNRRHLSMYLHSQLFSSIISFYLLLVIQGSTTTFSSSSSCFFSHFFYRLFSIKAAEYRRTASFQSCWVKVKSLKAKINELNNGNTDKQNPRRPKLNHCTQSRILHLRCFRLFPQINI